MCRLSGLGAREEGQRTLAVTMTVDKVDGSASKMAVSVISLTVLDSDVVDSVLQHRDGAGVVGLELAE